jgi:hypothetical protein
MMVNEERGTRLNITRVIATSTVVIRQKMRYQLEGVGQTSEFMVPRRDDRLARPFICNRRDR